jgi:hypothetical protein
MSKTYRVISPDYMWRHDRHASLTVSERDGLTYFLTSPFSNLIGLYPISVRVAAAEMGLSVGEFQTVSARLESLNLISMDRAFVLVHEWFLHSKPAAVLSGNVKPRALQEFSEAPERLRTAWVSACHGCGVPECLLIDFVALAPEARDATAEGPAKGTGAPPMGLASPSGAPAKGLGGSFDTELEPDLDNNGTTTTTPNPTAVVVDGQDAGASFTLELSELAEPHRRLLLESASDLTPDQIQEIGDELSERLDEAVRPQGIRIHSVRAWLMSLVEEAREGRAIASRGLRRANERAARRCRERQTSEQASRDASNRERVACELRRAEEVLRTASAAGLAMIVREAEAASPSPGTRERISRAVLARQLPSATARGAVLNAIRRLSPTGTGLPDAASGAAR